MPKRSPALEARRSELIVLMLVIEADRTGYEIRRLIKEWRIDRYLPVSPTTIYRALQRLEAEGCLTSRSRQSGNYPVSTVYAVTPTGEEKYHTLVAEESEFVRTAYSLDSFLGLALFVDEDTRRTRVHAWQEAARHRMEALNAAINDKVPGHTYGKAFPEWILMDHERDLLKAEIAWMDKYLEIGRPGPSKSGGAERVRHRHGTAVDDPSTDGAEGR